MRFLALVLALLIGLSLGLLGGGGAVLALPVFVYVLGIDPKTAIAMTLVVVGSASLLGAIPHARRGNIDWLRTVVFGSSTMLGAFLGARLALLPWVTAQFQMGLFAMAILAAASFMLRRQPPKADDPVLNYPRPFCLSCWTWLVSEGVGVGVLTGLVGVGGGFAIVPALVLLGKVPMRKAIGTSLAIIGLNAIAGLAGYWGRLSLPWDLTLTFAACAGLGTLLGSAVSQRISTQRLQKSFAIFLLAIGGFVLARSVL